MQTAVWSGSTLFAILCGETGPCKQQSDHDLSCLPFCLDRQVGANRSLIWIYPVCHSVWRDRSVQTAVWSRSTLFAILCGQTGLCKQQSDQDLRCLLFCLDRQVGANSSLIKIYPVCHSVGTDRSVQTAVWSGSTLFAILSGETGRCKQQSDQDLSCLPFCQDRQVGANSSLIRMYAVCHFVWTGRLVQTAVWSGSTLFAILSGQTGRCKQQSEQDVRCLPFYLDRQVDANSSLIRIYPVCLSVWTGRSVQTAVWSRSTVFAILSGQVGANSCLIRIYPVCHSVWTGKSVQTAVWSRSTLFSILSGQTGRCRQQSNQDLPCLPFCQDRQVGANSSLIWIYSVCHSVRTDRSVQTAVWSGSTLFAILSGQTTKFKQQSDQDLRCLQFCLDRQVGANSSLITIYPVCHSVWTDRSVQTAVWSGSTLFAILFGQTSRCKQQSDPDLTCLPFYQDRQVSANSSLIRIYLICHSVWTDRSVQTAVWSGFTLFAILSGQTGRCKEQSDLGLLCLPPCQDRQVGANSSLVRIYPPPSLIRVFTVRSMGC